MARLWKPARRHHAEAIALSGDVLGAPSEFSVGESRHAGPEAERAVAASLDSRMGAHSAEEVFARQLFLKKPR